MGEKILVEVNGTKVWYELVGDGDHVILLIPGVIGTGRTDFQELIDGEDELDFDKFTVIALDPPGHGKSRPPLKKYEDNYYAKDADLFHQVMEKLGHSKYSVIGWDEGAKAGLIMASKYPSEVQSLVLIGISNKSSTKYVKGLQAMKAVDKWPETKLEKYLRGYESKEEIQRLWTRFVSFVEFSSTAIGYAQNQPTNTDPFKDHYKSVKCPVLVVHGDQDPLIEVEQPLIISKRLPNAMVHRFANGGHDCHDRYAFEFKKVVEEHLLKPKDYTKDQGGKDGISDALSSLQ